MRSKKCQCVDCVKKRKKEYESYFSDCSIQLYKRHPLRAPNRAALKPSRSEKKKVVEQTCIPANPNIANIDQLVYPNQPIVFPNGFNFTVNVGQMVKYTVYAVNPTPSSLPNMRLSADNGGSTVANSEIYFAPLYGHVLVANTSFAAPSTAPTTISIVNSSTFLIIIPKELPPKIEVMEQCSNNSSV